MVRLSKQQRKRKISPRKTKPSVEPVKKISIKQFAKIHKNAMEGALQSQVFIPQVKTKEPRHV